MNGNIPPIFTLLSFNESPLILIATIKNINKNDLPKIES